MKTKDIIAQNKAQLCVFVPLSCVVGIALLFTPYFYLKQGATEFGSSSIVLFLLSTPGIAVLIIAALFTIKLRKRMHRDEKLVSAIENDDADMLSGLLEELDDSEVLNAYLIIQEKQNAKCNTVIKQRLQALSGTQNGGPIFIANNMFDNMSQEEAMLAPGFLFLHTTYFESKSRIIPLQDIQNVSIVNVYNRNIVVTKEAMLRIIYQDKSKHKTLNLTATHVENDGKGISSITTRPNHTKTEIQIDKWVQAFKKLGYHVEDERKQ